MFGDGELADKSIHINCLYFNKFKPLSTSAVKRRRTRSPYVFNIASPMSPPGVVRDDYNSTH